MSKRSMSLRSIAIGVSVAVLASTTAVSTAGAQSSEPILSSSSSSEIGNSSGSSSLGWNSGFCESTGQECEADNEIVQTRITPVVVGDQLTSTLEVTGLRDSAEDIALTYTAEEIEIESVTSLDSDVSISRDGKVYSILINGGLMVDETVEIIVTGTVTGDSPKQSVTTATGTPVDSFIRLLGGLSIGAIGIAAVVEHLHNIQWLTREQDQFWLQITGRDPNLTRKI